MSVVETACLNTSTRSPQLRREWLSVASHLDPKYGGIAAMLPELCAALSSDGESSAKLLGVCSEAEADHVPSSMLGSTFTMASSRWGWLLNNAWQQSLGTRLSSADVIHIHGLWEEHCVAAARAARTLGKPYVVSAHGMLDRWALSNKRVKKLIYASFIERSNVQGAACLHALTVTEAEDYRRFGATNPIAIVPNGVSVPAGTTGAMFLNEFPELRNRRLVLYLGRIHYKKGLDLLAQSWRHIAEQIPDAHLVIAGPDFENTRAAVEKKLSELGLAHRVTFTGMLSGPLKWSALAASETFVLPSYSEGFSMSVLEALGMGKPVVITRQCNVPEVAQHGCGWTIEPAVNELTAALLDALKSSVTSRREMGSNGKALVANHFSWQSVGQRMRSVYEWTLGGSQPGDVVIFQ